MCNEHTLQVKERMAASKTSDSPDEILNTFRSSSNTETGKKWDRIVPKEKKPPGNAAVSRLRTEFLEAIPKKAIALLLPANYPVSVAEGYFGFVSFCFTASIAGSASMVLSTQTLLLAVGIVGQNTSSAGLMAGALNWVMKDFMGQLGGILFASKMGKTKAFDTDPKRWRMVAAMALDGATLLEILSPLCSHSGLVLPIASVANIGKNIGFLTASASRASLHQSLAVSGNLGDVTVKAGSQSMAASLLGTSLGIGLSTIVLDPNNIWNFGMSFVCLSVVHQGCTYLSLQRVSLSHFNRNRLALAIDYYIKHHKKAPRPRDVSRMEGFFPLVSSWGGASTTNEWLCIGRPLTKVCPTPQELETCLACAPDEAYVIRVDETSGGTVDLVYFDNAEESDLLRGFYHASLIRHLRRRHQNNNNNNNNNVTLDKAPTIVRKTYLQVQEDFSNLLEELKAQGWDISSGLTTIEDESALRIQIERLR